MNVETRVHAPGTIPVSGKARAQWSFGGWPIWLGLLLLAIPAFSTLSQKVWSTEAGAHGPIVLFTGAWLIHHIHKRSTAAVTAPRWPIVIAVMLAGLAAFVFGRAYDFATIETGGLYIVFLAAVYRMVGGPAMRVLAFPLFYLAFLVPPPAFIIDRLTAPLQEFISYVATGTLSAFGYPIVRSGVALFIAQYQLLVEEACSGMNSIVGLVAISLFYIYMMHRASWRYALLLVAMVLPIAIAANLIRVMALVLITYYWGDAAAQGFLHVSAGLILFTIALALIFATDALFQRILNHKRVAAA